MKTIVYKTSFLLLFVAAVFFLNGCKCCKAKKSEKEALKKAQTECVSKCGMLPDPGTCKAYLPRYYFDTKEGKCKEFIWGGCEGSVPFQTLEECEQCDCLKK